VSELDVDGPSAELARRALDVLLDGDPRAAIGMLLESDAAEPSGTSRWHHDHVAAWHDSRR